MTTCFLLNLNNLIVVVGKMGKNIQGGIKMKIEEAYSLDYGGIVDAEKAYELYWEELIKDKKNFQCPDPNCDAQITCAGIDLPRDKMKKTLHFRIYGKHSEKCSLSKNINEQKRDKPNNTNENPMRYINSEIDVFLANRPKNHNIITLTEAKKESLKHNEIKKKIDKDINSGTKRIPKYSTIKPLISKYQKYSEEETVGNHYINIKENKISYKEMFVSLSDIKFELMSNDNRIYFGKAHIYMPNGKNDYILRFEEPIIKNKEEYYPSVYISRTLINKHYMSQKWEQKLEELKKSSKYEKVIFFVYSKPTYKEKTIREETCKFIDFIITSLDHFDYRYDN